MMISKKYLLSTAAIYLGVFSSSIGFITSALAEEASASAITTMFAGGFKDSLLNLTPLLFIFVIFYFLLIRPQQQKAKKHEEMLGKISVGQIVVSAGGIIGVVRKISDDGILHLEVAVGVVIQIYKSNIAEVLADKADFKLIKSSSMKDSKD